MSTESCKLKPSEVSFETVCNFLGRLQLYSRDNKRKYDSIHEFYNKIVDRSSGQAFDIMRLVLPQNDEVRGNYNLKEKALGIVIADALGWAKSENRATALYNFRDPGILIGSGDLSLIVYNILLRERFGIPPDAPDPQKKQLKVGDVNALLDSLVTHSNDRAEKQNILRSLIARTTARQMRWLVQIILKASKHGVGTTALFKAWHPDAEDYYNLKGMSLRAVYNDMIDEAGVYAATGAEPGLCLNPQLAAVAISPKVAFKYLEYSAKELKDMHKGGGRGTQQGTQSEQPSLVRPFLIETKFDGERMQVHRVDDTVLYFSRRGINHGEHSKYGVMDEVVRRALGPGETRCILDGELVVYNQKTGAMVPFGNLKHTVNEALQGKDVELDVGDVEEFVGKEDISWSHLEIIYIAFDVLFCSKGGSVISKRLEDRRLLLKRMLGEGISMKAPGVSGISLSVLPLLPCSFSSTSSFSPPYHHNDTSTTRTTAPWECFVASSLQDIDQAIERAKERRDEGILIKALDSQWRPGDRSASSWLKLKPDYMYRMDIDAVIVGGTFGKGSRAGEGITQYIMALRASPSMERRRRQGVRGVGGGSAGQLQRDLLAGASLGGSGGMIDSIVGSATATAIEEQEGKEKGAAENIQYVTFARVGTGLSAEERGEVSARLRGLLVHDKTAVPPNVIACGKEELEAWVVDPEMSIVLELEADVRLVASLRCATPFSLRFPRIVRIRDDKKPAQVTAEAQVWQQFIQSRKEKQLKEEDVLHGRRGGRGRGVGMRGKTIHLVGTIAEKQNILNAIVPESNILQGRSFFVLGSSWSDPLSFNIKAEIKRLGGMPWAVYVPDRVQYIVAPSTVTPEWVRGSGCGTVPNRSILSSSWIRACALAGTMVPLRPRHYLYLSPRDMIQSSSNSSRNGMAVAMDVYGDPFFLNSTAEDVEALLKYLMVGKMDTAVIASALEKYSKSVVGEKGGEGGGRGELSAWFDSELQGVDKFDPATSFMHGCVVLFVVIDNSVYNNEKEKEEEEEEEAWALSWTVNAENACKQLVYSTNTLKIDAMKSALRLCGARVVERIQNDVTHLVIVDIRSSTFDASRSIDGDDGDIVLRSIRELYGVVDVLRKKLSLGRTVLMPWSWAEECVALATSLVRGEHSGRGGGGLLEALTKEKRGREAWLTWPWSRYSAAASLGTVVEEELKEKEMETGGGGSTPQKSRKRGMAVTRDRMKMKIQSIPGIKNEGGGGGGGGGGNAKKAGGGRTTKRAKKVVPGTSQVGLPPPPPPPSSSFSFVDTTLPVDQSRGGIEGGMLQTLLIQMNENEEKKKEEEKGEEEGEKKEKKKKRGAVTVTGGGSLAAQYRLMKEEQEKKKEKKM